VKGIVVGLMILFSALSVFAISQSRKKSELLNDDCSVCYDLYSHLNGEMPVTVNHADEYADMGLNNDRLFTPTVEQLRVIQRLAEGLARWKVDGWWECGRMISNQNDIKALSYTYAYEIMRASLLNEEIVLNVWGMAGTMAHESRFDRCALGLHPRKTAYDLKLIKKNKMGISHTQEDILRAVSDKQLERYYSKTGYDLGVFQLLSVYYKNRYDYEYMISLRGGIEAGAIELARRAKQRHTKRPWAFWSGHYSKYYKGRVRMWARKLGATKQEI